MKKPKIGIVCNLLVMQNGDMAGAYRSYVNHNYVTSLEKAGCIPVQLPVIYDLDSVSDMVEGLDGVVLSGGYDVTPGLYGEEPMPQIGFTMKEVDDFYIRVIHEADQKNIPVFGICKGIQILNVACGGTLYQDLGTQVKGSYKHVQSAPRYTPSHVITIEKDSFLGSVLGEKAMVNSFHHQAVKEPAEGFRVTARAGDGVIEAIERTSGSFMAAVQFHPEMMAEFDNPDMLRLFQKFAEVCRINKEIA